ncbi:MAG: hypothetical protein GVY19_12865 [Bacteroidetes bacterium]|jgi:outer membrane protein|nr:hypothetical protein [Bacteroidota bacterium]
MKKVQLIINIVIALAVAALYVLTFTGQKHSVNGKTGGVDTTTISNLGGEVVYVNIDTVLNNYDLFHELSGDMEDKFNTAQAELSSKEKKYREGVEDFQYKVQRGLVTRSDAQKLQQELMKEEQEIMQLRDNLNYKLAEEEAVVQRQLINEIMVFLEAYNKEKGYTYVLANRFGSNILYAHERLDITWDVIEGLNEQYKKNQQKKK